MTSVLADIFFLDIQDAYAEAAKQQWLRDVNGVERLQYCYYDGLLTDIVLPNFIQVPADKFVEFFSHNQLPIPQLIAISQDGDVHFNNMPSDVIDEVMQYRSQYRVPDYVHFDTYFIDPLQALNAAKQRNRVACDHPTIDGLQVCYYRGELPSHGFENLIHLELPDLQDFFIRSRMRFPENLEIPEELDEDVKAELKQDIAAVRSAVERQRRILLQQLLNKAKTLKPRLVGNKPPRIFIPTSRLTTVMQYSSRGVAKAFADLGWDVLLYVQDNEMEGSNMVDMLEKYISFDPHACFYVNSLNNSFMHDDIVNLVWWQDLMPQLKNRQPLKWRARDFNLSISPLFDRYLEQCGASKVERLHFVIDDEIFHGDQQTARTDKIVFVGSSYLPVIDPENSQHKLALAALLAVMEQGGRFDEATVTQIAAASSLSYEFVFWKLLHYVIRDHAVKWLCAAQGCAGLPVDVYGRYWDQDAEVAAYYRGELQHGVAVADVYRSARYALVCHPFEINSQRLAEVAACGCIPLVYDCRDVAEPPHWDEYCLFFKTAEELQNILRQRLQPAKPPEGLARQFTYKAAVRRLIDLTDLRALSNAEHIRAPESVAVLPGLCGENVLLISSLEFARQTCLANLQNNLLCLAEYRPELGQALMAAWPRQQIAITVDQDIAGEYWRISVERDGKESYRLDNIALLEHKGLIENNIAEMTRENTCCYALVGLGSGYELLAVFNATALPITEMAEFEVPVYLLESKPEIWLLNLLLHDLRPLLLAPRVRIYHDEHAEADLFVEFSKFEAAVPDVLFNLDPQAPIGAERVYQLSMAAKQDKAERHLVNLQQIADYYSRITADEWRRKFSPEHAGQLRVLGYISRFSSFLKYCMRDWLDGFERLGATIRLCSETENYYLSNIEHLIGEINYFKPDIILIIDHFRHEIDGVPESVPFVNWIQDMLPNITDNKNAMHEMDFTFVFSKQWLAMNGGTIYKDYPAEYLPIGFNDTYYRPENNHQYDYDFLVISHLGAIKDTYIPFDEDEPKDEILNNIEIACLKSNQISFQDLSRLYRVISEYLNCLDLNSLHKLRMDGQFNGFKELKEVLRKGRFNINEKTFESLMVGSSSRFHNHYLFKVKTAPIAAIVNSGMKIRLGIYGKNWQNIKLFEPFAKGIAENGEVINRLMARSKICFNGSPGSTLHMRSIEIMAAGAFMISRRIYQDSSPLTDYFNESDIVFYENEAELIEKVRFFLENDELRAQLANTLHEQAIKIFSYKSIANIVMTAIVERLNSKG
ncbi:glycosyltransferase family protein [Methylomonas sp. MK1]|uniref:glycosyltransferase family protein n=1 Tax=Methylomonas sp. MK1 TaxID=1131552 RepID=UPI00039B7525|nr:glycosyltransferase [Methylomonas sp. MK1]